AHVHNHIIFNSVSDRDGHKYHSSPASYFREIRGLSDRLCREYGMSVIDEPNNRALTYVEWRMQKLGIRTQRQLVDRDVEECLSLAMDVGQFYALMEDRGYTVQHRSKYPTFVPYGDEHGHRARMKGKAMTEDDFIAYIDKAMTDPTFEVIMPRQQRVHFPRGKVTGFQACVLAWTYILGLVNDGVQMQRVVPPRELKRFEQLKKAAAYLSNNKIDTLEQLEERIADLTRQIDWQTRHRIILNGKKKRQRPLYEALQTMAMYEDRDEAACPLSPEEQNKLQKAQQILSKTPIDILKLERERLYADLVEVNRALRSLKTEVRLCEQIKADSAKLHENLKPFLTEDRELKQEFMNYER
ncbi:MAG: relaxase/mobilization nuclease domain-containing protein, partial [Clostridia bacterium]|nr:relaxase/mobilization nuclease domain-containing protein [Clostridia bacterium]